MILTFKRNLTSLFNRLKASFKRRDSSTNRFPFIIFYNLDSKRKSFCLRAFLQFFLIEIILYCDQNLSCIEKKSKTGIR